MIVGILHQLTSHKIAAALFFRSAVRRHARRGWNTSASCVAEFPCLKRIPCVSDGIEGQKDRASAATDSKIGEQASDARRCITACTTRGEPRRSIYSFLDHLPYNGNVISQTTTPSPSHNPPLPRLLTEADTSGIGLQRAPILL